jgi:hypothetical protein
VGNKQNSLAQLELHLIIRITRKVKATKELPKDVIAVKKFLSSDSSDDLYDIAEKLIANSPELIAMWRTLEKRKVGEDDLWVWSFLRNAADASNLPPFHYINAKERRKLSSRITTLANQLARELEQNELDVQLVYSEGKTFNGFFLYEDFGESNQARIDADKKKKLKVSLLIQKIAERAEQRIAHEPTPGKTSANVRAIRFIRIISAYNKRRHGKPLSAATATAANAIFDTSYQESDIAKLLNR